MGSRAILLTALAVGSATAAHADPILSTFSLLGTPLSPNADIPISNPLLVVSLNPEPPPPVPDPNSGLNLSDSTVPVYFYPTNPAFEIADFSFDIEQVLSTGTESGGAGAGKVTFNPFQITSNTGDAVIGKLQLVDAPTNAVLETIDVNIAGIDPNTLTPSIPDLLPCGAVPCAFEGFSFAPVAPDPVVSFSVMSGSTDFAFSMVPEPSTWAMMGLGFASLGFASYRARRAAIPNA